VRVDETPEPEIQAGSLKLKVGLCDICGKETFQTALRATRKNGTLVNVAIWEEPVEIDLNDIVLNELKVVGTIAFDDKDFSDTIDLIQSGKIRAKVLATVRVPLSEVVERGFEELMDHKDRHMKILVRSSE
jgi:(R,R)-butanediol dehydrogenase / meso-butanediol dehydrogenase / diacetyl reductase